MTFEKILIVDDETPIRKLLEHYLRRQRYVISSVGTLTEGKALLASERFDMVFLDLSLPDGNGLDLLRSSRENEVAPTFVIMSGTNNVGAAVECMRNGAFDYMAKPFSPEDLDVVIKRAESFCHVLQVNRYMERELRASGAILGHSPVMQTVRELVEKVASTETAVLITGESGVGKECIAQAIHAASARSAGPLITIQCGATSEEEIDGALFGRDGGRLIEGALELAQRGTIVLDEIGELPMRAQVRLHRVLQDRQFERPGCGRPIPVDARIIATTDRDLVGLIAQGTFRRDLYFRLNVFPLNVPPLRDRLADLPQLVGRWMEKFARQKGAVISGISEEAIKALMTYSWPGNVRELENALERAAILTGLGCRIEAGAFDFLRSNGKSTGGLVASGGAPEPLLTLEELEKRHVLKALEFTNQNRTRAASLLKISVRTLRNKLHQYRAESPENPAFGPSRIARAAENLSASMRK